MGEMTDINISDQIKCVVREIKKREYVYPKQVAAGKMTQQLADTELERMRAVLDTLNRVMQEQEFKLT